MKLNKIKGIVMTMFLICSFLMFGQQKRDRNIDKVYLSTDDRELFVYFPGGNDGITSESLLLKYIAKNLTYPDSAYNAKREGKVFVSFTIDINGKISDIKITKGSNPYFDKEVIRLISNMPNWVWDEKIKKSDRKLTTRTLPINFSLK
jgi:TonB family protein